MGWTVRVDDDAARDIRKLPDDLQSRFLRTTELVRDYGPQSLPPGYVKHIEGAIWELRLIERSGIARVFYFTVRPRQIVVLSAFKKTSQKTPLKELEKARRRWKAKS